MSRQPFAPGGEGKRCLGTLGTVRIPWGRVMKAERPLLHTHYKVREKRRLDTLDALGTGDGNYRAPESRRPPAYPATK
jgi:hypothetical protein